MIDDQQDLKIGPAGLEPTVFARNRRKAFFFLDVTSLPCNCLLLKRFLVEFILHCLLYLTNYFCEIDLKTHLITCKKIATTSEMKI